MAQSKRKITPSTESVPTQPTIEASGEGGSGLNASSNIRLNTVSFALLLYRASTELMIVLPLLFLLHALVLTGSPIAIWFIHFLAVYVLCGALRQSRPDRSRWLLGLIALALGVGLALILYGSSVQGIILALLGTAFAIRGLISSSFEQWRNSFSVVIYWVGLLIYFLSSIIFSYVIELQPYRLAIMLVGIACLIVTIFRTNATSIQAETRAGNTDQTQASASVLRHNRLLLLPIFGLIVLIAMLGYIQQGLQYLWNQLMQFVSWILSLLGGEGSEPAAPPAAEPPPSGLPPMEPSEPPAWLVLIEKVVYYTVIVVVVALVLLMLYFIGKALIRVIKRGMNWLLGRMEDVEAVEAKGYKDEKISLMTWQTMRKQALNRLFKPRQAKELSWAQLPDNQARIRYLYRQWLKDQLKSGYTLKPWMTPFETREDIAVNLKHSKEQEPPAEWLELYHLARYGERAIADDEVERMKAWLSKKGKH